jgi:hypothetical protein
MWSLGGVSVFGATIQTTPTRQASTMAVELPPAISSFAGLGDYLNRGSHAYIDQWSQ